MWLQACKSTCKYLWINGREDLAVQIPMTILNAHMDNTVCSQAKYCMLHIHGYQSKTVTTWGYDRVVTKLSVRNTFAAYIQ